MKCIEHNQDRRSLGNIPLFLARRAIHLVVAESHYGIVRRRHSLPKTTILIMVSAGIGGLFRRKKTVVPDWNDRHEFDESANYFFAAMMWYHLPLTLITTSFRARYFAMRPSLASRSKYSFEPTVTFVGALSFACS